MSMASMLAAIVSNVDAALPGLRQCAAHDGQFSDDDLRRYLAVDPAVYVSCLGSTGSEDQNDDLVVTAQWVMIVVTRRDHAENDSATRTTTALDLVEQLMFLVRNNGTPEHSWASEVSRAADKIRSRNLFNRNTDRKGVSLWAITWEQDVSVAQFDDTLVDFLRARTTFELTDSTGELTTESVFDTTVREPTP